MSTEEFIQKAKAVHGDKYDYSKVEYVNSYTKVCITCPTHGEFWQGSTQHLRGHGCPKCAAELSASKLRIWTKERVFEEAHKYTTKRDFYKGNRSAYAVAERNRWFDEMEWFKKPNPNKPKVWTKEAVFVLAKTCKTKLELRKANKGAYNVAWKNGWLNEMDWLDALVRDPYTKEEVLSIARQFNTKIDFRKAVPNVYGTALKNGWLDEMTWFFTSPQYDRHNYCVYVYTDETNKVAYVGLTVDRKRRHFNHATGYDRGGKSTKSPVYVYFQSIGQPVPNPIYLEERLNANEAREKEHEWRMKYQEMGYRLLNTAKTGANIGSLGSAALKWTKPRVIKESKQYHSRSEFALKSPSAYDAARRNNLLDGMPWLKPKIPSRPTSKWTKETIFEESKKYATRREFSSNARTAYQKAMQSGWLDEMPWLKVTPIIYNPRKIYSKEKILEISKKYNSRSSFARGNSQAYHIACKEKWLDEMPWLVLRTTYESMKESIFDESHKYQSLSEFKSSKPDIYAIALKKRWLKEMTWLCPVLRLQYAKEEVFEISRKYKSKSSFRKGEKDVYNYAEKNGWLDEMTWFVTPHAKWTRQEVFELSRQYSSRKEFEKNARTAYDVARKKNWLEEMPWLVKQLHDAWTKEEVFEESRKYTSRTAFSKGNGTAYSIARKNNWLDDMPWLVLNPIKWTRESVFEESRKFKSKGEFLKKSSSAYNVARHNNWLNEMTWLKPQLKTWDMDKVIQEAKKFPSKAMFHNKSSVAYRVALRNGWMDKITVIVGWN